MFNTSAAYREAIQADVRDFRIKGTLTSRDEDIVEFIDTDVVLGSYVHNASSQPGDLFQHGGAVAKDMSIQIYDREYDEVDPQFINFSGGTIDVQVGVIVADETTVWIPMGKFLIDEFSQKDEIMTIRAMDEMVRLDESYNNSNIGYPATLKQIYVNICADMDITPRTTTFLNDTIRVSTKPEDVTYREVLQALAELSGTFAQMHRNGGLELKWYENQEQYEITPNERFAFNQSDFIVGIPGISYSITQEGEEGEEGLEFSHFFGEEEGALDISENLLLPYIEDKVGVVQGVYDKVSTFEFIPYETNFVGDPSLDVGDVITQITNRDKTYLTPITELSFTFRGNQDIIGKGLDYRVNKFQGTISSTIKQIVKDQGLALDAVTDMEKAIEDMSDLIVNTMGGHLTTTDGEIYIHDMPNLDDSTHVWKWGLGGFGYSETGVDGTYVYGIDANSTLVAKLISAGIVTADMIQTGILQTQDGSSWINLTKNHFKLGNISFDENGFNISINGENLKETIVNKANKDTLKTEINLSEDTAKITAENIKLEGTVTANENFKVLLDGSIKTKNADISGNIKANDGKIGEWKIANSRLETNGEKGNAFLSGGNWGALAFTVNSYDTSNPIFKISWDSPGIQYPGETYIRLADINGGYAKNLSLQGDHYVGGYKGADKRRFIGTLSNKEPIMFPHDIIPNLYQGGGIGTADKRYSSIRLVSNPDVSSDIRHKSLIQDIPQGLLEEIKKVKPKMFQMKESMYDKEDGEKTWHFGYIAQDIERAIYKYALNEVGFKDAKQEVNKYNFLSKGQSYLSLVYAEIAVLKDAEKDTKINELEQRIERLEQLITKGQIIGVGLSSTTTLGKAI